MMDSFNFEHEKNIETKYYEGFLIDKWTTPQDNIMIRIKNTQKIVSIENVIVKRNAKLDELNFLVPRRRTYTTTSIKNMSIGIKVQVKLLQETRSGKFTVAKIIEVKY
jgi:hypothetical protein